MNLTLEDLERLKGQYHGSLVEEEAVIISLIEALERSQKALKLVMDDWNYSGISHRDRDDHEDLVTESYKKVRLAILHKSKIKP